MIISEEQARAALDHLRTQRCKDGGACRSANVTAEILELAKAAANEAPDMRVDRVAEARARLASGTPDAEQIAHKMLCRILSDSVR